MILRTPKRLPLDPLASDFLFAQEAFEEEFMARVKAFAPHAVARARCGARP